jgi:hypothetical protein
MFFSVILKRTAAISVGSCDVGASEEGRMDDGFRENKFFAIRRSAINTETTEPSHALSQEANVDRDIRSRGQRKAMGGFADVLSCLTGGNLACLESGRMAFVW